MILKYNIRNIYIIQFYNEYSAAMKMLVSRFVFCTTRCWSNMFVRDIIIQYNVKTSWSEFKILRLLQTIRIENHTLRSNKRLLCIIKFIKYHQPKYNGYRDYDILVMPIYIYYSVLLCLLQINKAIIRLSLGQQV